ncbi:MAG: hypothetical protein HOP15_02700 [Planctomycetes bacterium]|nr:hypothetical protein [Planctomycetota bacterium]
MTMWQEQVKSWQFSVSERVRCRPQAIRAHGSTTRADSRASIRASGERRR